MDDTPTLFGMTPDALAVTIAVLLAMLWARVQMARSKVPPGQWGSVFVSLGILGTFTGIILALWKFDTENINDSVPRLMAGMRSAFLTSAVGMFWAVASKLRGLLGWGADDTKQGAQAQDYFALLQEHKAATEAQTELLGKLLTSIAGDGDQSLLTATVKNRDILRDIKDETHKTTQSLEGMRKDLKTFTDEISNKSTDAIIEALERVVKDFNNTINEQFGENFKQLNEAVGKLLVWMERHKDLVEEGHKELSEATQTLQETQKTLQTAAKASEKVAKAAGAVMDKLIQAVAALETLRGILSGIQQPTENLAKQVETLTSCVTDLATANDGLKEALDAWTGLAGEAHEASDAIVKMTQAVHRNSGAVATEHKKLLELIEKNLKESGTKNRVAIENQINQLDKALEDELQKALKLIGGKLGSLSEKFARDYGPLTAELARIVALAREQEAGTGGGRRG